MRATRPSFRSGVLALVIAVAPAGRSLAAPDAERIEIGKGRFKSPETAIWDDQQDRYLVSNVNGGLTAIDDNGFISLVLPGGEIAELKWIDGAQPDVALDGPKGMLLTQKHLVVADVQALRFFDRITGRQLRSIAIPGAYMLNDPARSADGTLYVTDTGGETADDPGAVYRIADDGDPVILVQGIEYDRPDGLLADEQGLVVAPFEAHAADLYRLNSKGERTRYAKMPQPKLDGLLALPDGSLIVTSWAGKAVYRLEGTEVTVVARNLRSPAQIGYDRKRQRLLVPLLQENTLLTLALPAAEKKLAR